MSSKEDFEQEVLELKRLLYKIRCRALAENYHMPSSLAKEVIRVTDRNPDVEADALLIDDIDVLLDTIEYLCEGPYEYHRAFAKKILTGTFPAFTMPQR